MKLIEKKESSKTPELIWGEKYKLLKTTGSIQAGETVILASAKPDSYGMVKVLNADYCVYAETEDLQLITDEPQKEAETTYTIEFTESELEAVVFALGECPVFIGFEQYEALDAILDSKTQGEF